MTSKAAIVGPSSRVDADVDYTFAQVGVAEATVDWGGNCGNISSAVGPYAINHGLVRPFGPTATVRIHNTNTGKVIVARVPVEGGRAKVQGDCSIPGVPGTGARIMVEFADPAGAVTGELLPTGKVQDTVVLDDGREFTVSVVDAANPVVFLRAEELGLHGTESPDDLGTRTDATDAMESVRSVVAEWLGLVDDPAQATAVSPGLPKVGYVAAPVSYVTTTGRRVEAGEMHLAGRLMTMQTPHQSYMAAGAICTAAAALVPGTIVHQVATVPDELANDAESRVTVRIGHPYGVMTTEVSLDPARPTPSFSGIAVERTAREIMSGVVHVPRELLLTRDSATSQCVPTEG